MLRFLILALVAYGSGTKLEKDEVLVCSTDPKGRPLQDFQLPPGYSEDYLPVPYGSKKLPLKSLNRPMKGGRADVLYVVPGTPTSARGSNQKSAKQYRPYYDEHIAEFIKEQPGQNAPPVHGEYLAEMMFEHSKSADASKQTRQLKSDSENKYMAPYENPKYPKYNPAEHKLEQCDPKDPFCDKYEPSSKIDPYSKYEPLKKSDKFYSEFKNIKSYDPKNYDLSKSVKYDPIYDSKIPKFDFDPLTEIKSSDLKGTKYEQFEPIYDSKNTKFQYEPLKEEIKGSIYDPSYDSKSLKVEYEPIRELKNEEPKFKYDPIYNSQNSKFPYDTIKELKNEELKEFKYDPIYDSKNSKFQYETIKELKNEEPKEFKYDPIYDSKNSKFQYETIKELRNDEPKEFKYDPVYDSKNSKFDYEPLNENLKYSKFENYEPVKNKPGNYEMLEEKNEPNYYDSKKFENFEPIRDFKRDSAYVRSNFEEKYPTFSNRRNDPDSLENEKRAKSYDKAASTFKKMKTDAPRRGPESNYYMDESKESRGVTKKTNLPPPCPEEESESCDCI